MYRTGAPALAPGRAGPVRELPIRVEMTCARVFLSGRPLADAGLDEYFRDLVAASGVGSGWTTLDGAPVTSYTAMAGEVLAALAPRAGVFDHIVLAHATPDIDCRASVGCYLVDAAAGEPLVFCVSDQGRVAPFSALRVAAEFRRGTPLPPAPLPRPPCSARSLVLALDQSTVPWEVERRDLVPAYDAAVALVLQAAPAGQGLLLSQHAAVPPGEVPDRMVEFLRLAAERSGSAPALVAGRTVPLTPAVAARAAHIRRAKDGRVCTAVWATAHELVATATMPGGMVLAEYDPDLRYLSLAALGQGVTPC